VLKQAKAFCLQANFDSGGAVSLSNSQVVMSRGSFDGNKAMEGGALAVEGESNVEIGACILSKNGAGLRVAPTGFPQQLLI
jgi:hypothetical protein